MNPDTLPVLAFIGLTTLIAAVVWSYRRDLARHRRHILEGKISMARQPKTAPPKAKFGNSNQEWTCASCGARTKILRIAKIRGRDETVCHHYPLC